MKHKQEVSLLGEIADYLFEGLVLTDEEGYIRSLNQSFSNFFPKLLRSDLLNKRIGDTILSKDLNHFYRHKQDMRNIHLSIGLFQLLANFHVLNNGLFLLNFKNITKIQQLGDELKSTQQHIRSFQYILDTLDEGICAIDNNQKIIFYNRKMGELDSREPAGVIGKLYSSIFEDSSYAETPILHSLSAERKLTQNEAFFSNTGKRYIVKRSSEPLYLGSLKTGALSTVKDFSDTAAMAETIFQFKNKKHTTGAPIKKADIPPPIVHVSKTMQKVLQQARLAADSTSNLLICGAHGVGKRLIYKHIVNQSQQRLDDVHEINCAAVSELLLEEILFGSNGSAGLLEQHSKGIILLGNIDHMSISLQKKVLEVIKEQKLRVTAKGKEVPVTVQFITLLSDKPHLALQKGALLEDLFYALSSITLNIPALHERKEDIAPLIEHLLKNEDESQKMKNYTVSSEAMKILTNYHYPGNVLQLKYIIEGARALVKEDNGLITPDHLPTYLVQHIELESNLPFLSSCNSLTEQVETFEKELILRMLNKTNMHITHTAENLSISRQSLNYKIRKYAIKITREVD
ncbi:sigma 54-interacting transcriptional regulator [Planococcus sp. SE5232]|uniref:sigma 54-interacting transcriptional regulator n=1 Tax=unclassified Planococcus (in: firmicutes) TaxID=2662419 RepID=UPI003D6A6F02